MSEPTCGFCECGWSYGRDGRCSMLCPRGNERVRERSFNLSRPLCLKCLFFHPPAAGCGPWPPEEAPDA